jgi:hypothetical protein
MKIPLGDFTAKLRMEGILKLTAGNESLQENINGNGVRVLNVSSCFMMCQKEGPMTQEENEMNVTHQRIVYADYISREWAEGPFEAQLTEILP